MDLETIYGPSQEVNALLRQKDKSGNLKCELILDNDYLPLNDARFNFIMPGRPGQQANLFAGGDLRTNQDFVRVARVGTPLVFSDMLMCIFRAAVDSVPDNICA